MKKLFTNKKFLIGMPLVLILGFFCFVYFDAYYGNHYYRTLQDDFTSPEQVNLSGLKEMYASGGGQPRFEGLSRRLSFVKQPKMIIDVKCEPHGYVNGVPSIFLGYGLNPPGFRHYIRRLLLTGTFREKTEAMISEEEEAKKYGFVEYKTVNIGSRFTAVDKNIDEIVDLLSAIPKDMWVHVHCSRGRGRTSMILAMLDMIRNAPEVSFEDIVKRQYLLGSVDLLDTKVWLKGTYTQEQLENRRNFIFKFYDFIVQRKAGGIQSWSEWHAMHQQQEVKG